MCKHVFSVFNFASIVSARVWVLTCFARCHCHGISEVYAAVIIHFDFWSNITIFPKSIQCESLALEKLYDLSCGGTLVRSCTWNTRNGRWYCVIFAPLRLWKMDFCTATNLCHLWATLWNENCVCSVLLFTYSTVDYSRGNRTIRQHNVFYGFLFFAIQFDCAYKYKQKTLQYKS